MNNVVGFAADPVAGAGGVLTFTGTWYRETRTTGTETAHGCTEL